MERNDLMEVFTKEVMPAIKERFIEMISEEINKRFTDDELLKEVGESARDFAFYRWMALRDEQEQYEELKDYRKLSERYDYDSVIKEDVMEYIKEHYNEDELREKLEDRDDFEQELYDDCFVSDSVTGNASGSYFFNTWRAENAICHNLELLGDAFEEFGDDGDVLKKGAESCDVTIRCYLLGSAISDALDEIEEELPDVEDDEEDGE